MGGEGRALHRAGRPNFLLSVYSVAGFCEGGVGDSCAPCDAARVPGCAPGGAVTFFGQKKSPKKAHPLSATPSLREGASCVGLLAGCAAELTVLLRSSVQTTAASQTTKHQRTCADATPQAARRRRRHKGLDSQTAEQPSSRAAEQPNSQTAKQPNSQTAKQPNSHVGYCGVWCRNRVRQRFRSFV